MCGICGIINLNGGGARLPDLLGAMCDVISHRGPDEDGVFIEGGVALGMRRLKIIDLSTGSQPIFNEDRSVVIFFNGEIYNFLELRENLIKKGHRFYTNTDTEVIVHLYEDFGESFLQYLNGMFGIAVWDRKKQKLLLARDRMGEKPVYYTLINNTLIFGSEIKSILCYPKIQREMDPTAVYHYFTFNYVPAPLTVYKEIYKLRPAEYLTWCNGTLKTEKYWDAQFAAPPRFSEDEVRERLYPELVKAVKYRLISDVPLGAFLSGGIDSSIMVALMSEASNSPVKTFSIGLENSKESELPFARAVAERYETEHHELIAKPEAADLLNRIVWHFDEPFADPSALPTFLVSRLTRDYVTVAISGDGGDELFGGYERYLRILNRNIVRKIPKSIRYIISKYIGNPLSFGFKGKAFLQSLQYDNYRFFTTGTTEELKRTLFTDDFMAAFHKTDSYEVASSFLVKNQSLLNQCMYFDLKVYLPDDILTKVDRMSMANSLETRAPFLDHQLVEFAMSIPESLKINNGVSKYILKKIFKAHLPENVYTHKKTGFSIPIGDWFKNELKSLVIETLSKRQVVQTGILNYAFVEKIISQHMSGFRNHDKLIWIILMFQLWHQNWLTGEPPELKRVLTARNVKNG